MKTAILLGLLAALAASAPVAPVTRDDDENPPQPELFLYPVYDVAPTECRTYKEGDAGWARLTTIPLRSGRGYFQIPNSDPDTFMVGYHFSRPVVGFDWIDWATYGDDQHRFFPCENNPSCMNQTTPDGGAVRPISENATCGALAWPMRYVTYRDHSGVHA